MSCRWILTRTTCIFSERKCNFGELPEWDYFVFQNWYNVTDIFHHLNCPNVSVENENENLPRKFISENPSDLEDEI